jgi:type VI secretion system protein ImpA
MPLRDDLLNPISGENPSGENLRYAPIVNKIKDARREEDTNAFGEKRVADIPLVIKLCSEALATQSKDLQIAAWLTEAMVRKEGFAGLQQSLELIKGLVENFWDTLYPEIEDGDLELRAAPLEWVGTRLVDHIKFAPFTKGGEGFYRYKETRTIPSEQDANENPEKAEIRNTAIADGKLTPEEFEKDCSLTSTQTFEARLAAIDGCIAVTEALNEMTSEKFGNFAPTFNPLRDSLAEVRVVVNGIVQKRLEAEGRIEAPEAGEEEPGEETSGDGTAAAPRRKKAVLSLEPEDANDAAARLAAVARFLRAQDAYSPAPYLLLRGFRWGELRGYGNPPDPTQLLPPTTEMRQNIKRLSLEGNWSDMIEAGETAMAQPCGRAWIDLQRYVVRACDESGYYAVAAAIRAELRALLTDLPGLPILTLMDDTPTANAETQAWLQELLAAPASAAGDQPAAMLMEQDERMPVPVGEPLPPDTYTLALEAARSGRASEAIELLAVEIPRERSGRARFQRRLQLAQICMMTGHESLAQPILEELAQTIDHHRLDEWEASDVVAHPLVLLYRCIHKLDGDNGIKQKLYSRISRLDPVQAMQCLR